jgi:hypothetical protein
MPSCLQSVDVGSSFAISFTAGKDTECVEARYSAPPNGLIRLLTRIISSPDHKMHRDQDLNIAGKNSSPVRFLYQHFLADNT